MPPLPDLRKGLRKEGNVLHGLDRMHGDLLAWWAATISQLEGLSDNIQYLADSAQNQSTPASAFYATDTSIRELRRLADAILDAATYMFGCPPRTPVPEPVPDAITTVCIRIAPKAKKQKGGSKP
ncbi:MAG: hypothetical protein JWO38_749 [Gemmataceae bacterium]|nr:hypothetical protein [Gemmataceae bacterium]